MWNSKDNNHSRCNSPGNRKRWEIRARNEHDAKLIRKCLPLLHRYLLRIYKIQQVMARKERKFSSSNKNIRDEDDNEERIIESQSSIVPIPGRLSSSVPVDRVLKSNGSFNAVPYSVFGWNNIPPAFHCRNFEQCKIN